MHNMFTTGQSFGSLAILKNSSAAQINFWYYPDFLSRSVSVELRME